jgi:hemoglobin/transferrin/lactoferrin receptor protein
MPQDSTEEALQQVVVSATRWEQPRGNLPYRVSKITNRSVVLQNPQTAADLLGLSGEVFIQKSQQGGGSPMIRGFGTNRLYYAVDGVRMNSAIFRSGNLQNVISLDPFAVEETEILFGPGSVMYGSDAIGGVMSFRTLTPRLSDTGGATVLANAAARYSSANAERTGHFDFQLGTRKWAFLTSFSHHHFGDLRQGRHGPEDYLRKYYVGRIDNQDVVLANPDPRVQTSSGYEQLNLMQKIRFSPGPAWNFQYGFHYSATSDFARYDRLQRLSANGTPRSAEWRYGPQVWMMNLLEAQHHAGHGGYDRMSLRAAHQYFEESRIDRDFDDSERRTRLEKVLAYSLNADFQKALGDRHQLFYGLEAVVNEVRSTGTDEDISTGAVVAGPSRYPASTWGSAAVYLSHQWQVSERFVLYSGIRYNLYGQENRFDTTFYPFPYTTAQLRQSAPTGSLGMVYRPAGTWSLSANLSTGFRAPNVDDAGKVFDSSPGNVVVPNPNLLAEYAYNAELGLTKSLGKYVRLSLSGYYTYLQNALAVNPFRFNGQDSLLYDGQLSQVLANQNSSHAQVYGFQASVECRFGHGLGLVSHFNLQEGEQIQPDGSATPLAHRMPMFGSTHLTCVHENLRLDVYAQYCARADARDLPLDEIAPYLYAKDENGDPYAPAWYTLNLKASYRVSPLLTISGGVENLLDLRYRPLRSGISAPGRNFILAVQGRFGHR